jgi:hypothetical protein
MCVCVAVSLAGPHRDHTATTQPMPTFNVRSGHVPEEHVPPARDEQIKRLIGGIGRDVNIDRSEGRVEITFVMVAEDTADKGAVARAWREANPDRVEALNASRRLLPSQRRSYLIS